LQAEIIFTGNELLLGEVLNTHAQYLGRELSAQGIEVKLHTTVGDNWAMLKKVLQSALNRSSLLIVTGGLGPTDDDLTKETVADLLGLDLVMDGQTLAGLEDIFARRGVTMPKNMKKQALLPRGARIFPNPVGTAPGILLQTGGKTIILLPGPPRELKAVFEGSVKKYLASVAGRGMVMRSKLFKLTGISESQVQDKLRGVQTGENTNISYVAMPGEVHVRVTGRGENEQQAQKLVDDLSVQVSARIGGYVFGVNDEMLEQMVGRLLASRRLTVSVAESCTGGLVAKRLTDVPGSSRYFLGGVVAYSNEVKIKQLGVPREVIARFGAVSDETARLMAEGIRRVTGSALGLGITGIAGPGGGTPEKPVGLVYIALAGDRHTNCRQYRFPGQRDGVRSGAANASLNMLRQFILQVT